VLPISHNAIFLISANRKYIYRVIQEERSIFYEVAVSVIERKKCITYVYLILNGN